MSGMVLLFSEAFIYFGVMAWLFRLRHRMGLGVFFCALGVMHFLETYLAAVFFIPLPFGLISPGSTVLFSGKLAIILLLYIREDAETVRQPIYGLLVGNFLMVALVLTLRLYGPAAPLAGYNPDLTLMDQMGVLMVWGTTLLFIDSIALILLYERLRPVLGQHPGLRAFVSLACMLSFDQVFFFLGLHLVTGTPLSALVGGWIAKMGAAATFSTLMAVYLHFFERDPIDLSPQKLADVFSKLTYRHKYEALLDRSGFDGLTGALNRERFETLGQSSLLRCFAAERPVSLALIDVDHFKAINDRYGHVTGDEVLRRIVDGLKQVIRGDDRIFRYGGEEFVVLCEGLPHAAAINHAERLRRAAAQSVDHELALAPTVSIGVATFPDDAGNIVDLVRVADARLYEAKRLGRDRVVGANEPLQRASA